MFVSPRNVRIFGCRNFRTFRQLKFASPAQDVSDNIVTSDIPDINLPQKTIQDLVYENVHKWSDKIALECGVTGRSYTYNDVCIKSRNLSKALRKKLKLRKGDVVAVLLPNIPEYSIAILGCLTAGLTLTTINPLYTSEEIFRQLDDSSAKAIITLTGLHKTIEQTIGMSSKPIPIIAIKNDKSDSTPRGAINFTEFTDDNSIDIEDVNIEPKESLAFMPYSSGTTGLPKGVELTHYNVVSNILQTGVPEYAICEYTTRDHQDVLPLILPMFHIYGLTTSGLYMLSRGAKLVTIPKFTPQNFVSIFVNYKPSILCLVPPLVLFLSTHPEIKSEHLSSVRSIICGAAPLGLTDEERLLEKAKKPIVLRQGYGMTEAAPVVSMVPLVSHKKYDFRGSIGKPPPNTLIKIVPADNPEGEALGPNSPGELLVKGPQVMRGYRNKPEQTKEVFVNGWLRSGDIGYYNENRVLYITDRLKELIKVKGFQVPPAELEEVIRSFPDVSDAGVIGVPHPTYGEVPRAYVVPKDGKRIDTKKLNEFVSSKVAKYKNLTGGIAIVDSIPKNASGKILRRLLKLQYEEAPK